MKKILCLFGALTLLLTSCSSNDSSDSSSNSSDTTLLKKKISTDSDGKVITTNYTYDGNKIVSEIDDSGDSNVFFTYTGDLITKLEFKLPDGTVEQINTYAYMDGKLTTFVRINPDMDLGNKEIYTYNEDGTVTVEEYIGDSKEQTQHNSTGIVKFSNGEVLEISNDNASSDIHKYTYDTKNSPMKNVLGWNKIRFTDGAAIDVLHNMLTDKVGIEFWSNYTYTYNGNDYPIQSVDSIERETVVFFY